MKIAEIILAVAAGIAGIIAAFYWHRSSKINIEPGWYLDPKAEVTKNIMGHVTGAMIAFRKSSLLNEKAALWTATSVVLSAAASIVGAFSN